MPITAAPRARARSTVRLVSVVVPLWLTAMTRVSSMRGRRWKPDSSVAVMGSMSRWSRDRRASSAATDWRGHRGRALADAQDPPDGALLQPRPDGRRQDLIAQGHPQPAVLLDDVAAQGLGEAQRRLADLLEQEVGGIPAVDVAGGDLGLHDLLGADRQRRPVVGQPHEALELAGRCRGERQDLPVAQRLVRVGRCLAVHADVAVRDLHQTVRFAGHDREVVGETDVHALPAPPERQQHLAGVVGAGGRDGDRAVERADRPPEGLHQAGAGAPPVTRAPG